MLHSILEKKCTKLNYDCQIDLKNGTETWWNHCHIFVSYFQIFTFLAFSKFLGYSSESWPNYFPHDLLCDGLHLFGQ